MARLPKKSFDASANPGTAAELGAMFVSTGIFGA